MRTEEGASMGNTSTKGHNYTISTQTAGLEKVEEMAPAPPRN